MFPSEEVSDQRCKIFEHQASRASTSTHTKLCLTQAQDGTEQHDGTMLNDHSMTPLQQHHRPRFETCVVSGILNPRIPNLVEGFNCEMCFDVPSATRHVGPARTLGSIPSHRPAPPRARCSWAPITCMRDLNEPTGVQPVKLAFDLNGSLRVKAQNPHEKGCAGGNYRRFFSKCMS